MTAGVSEDNPTPFARKGGSGKKRAAKDTQNDDDEEETPKPKKRAKKAKGPELNGEEVDKMMGLGGGDEVKVKPEPEDADFGWDANGDDEQV
jgi:hypothetical protein